MASSFWDVCNQGTKCLPWNPGNPKDQPDWGVTGERSDYGIPLPQGTPVQSPVSGIVLGQHPGGGWYSVFGQQSFGGEVDVLTNVPEYGGLVNVGVIHMDTASVVPGQVVQKGTILGTSGGQTSGGHWPSSPKYSSGPHVGVQVHSIFNWGDLKDPGILMQNLWAGKDTSSVPTTNQLTSSKLMQVTQGGPANGCNWDTWVRCLIAGNPANCAVCTAQAASNTATALSTCQPWDIACIVTTALKAGVPGFVRVAKFFVGVLILSLATFITFLPEVGAGFAIAAGVPEAAPAVSQALGGRRRLPQTQVGAGVQAVSIFKAHGQRKERETRANVVAVRRGQPAPFPASPGAPNQPAPRGRAAAGAAPMPTPAASSVPAPSGGGVGGKRGKAAPRPAPKGFKVSTPATPPAQPPAVQRGPKTQWLPHIPGTPGPPTPSHQRLGSPINPAPPPPQPGTGKDNADVTGRWPILPTPHKAKEPRVEPPMPEPVTPTTPSKQPLIPPRVVGGAPSRVGAGRQPRRKGQVATPRPGKGLTFEQALERVRKQTNIPSRIPLPSGIATAPSLEQPAPGATAEARKRQDSVIEGNRITRGFDDILRDLREKK